MTLQGKLTEAQALFLLTRPALNHAIHAQVVPLNVRRLPKNDYSAELEANVRQAREHNVIPSYQFPEPK